MKILGTGLTGLVGTRVTELLGDVYGFENINLGGNFDILDRNAVFKAVESSKASLVLHMAAKTNVDGCEKDKLRDKEILSFKSPNDREKAFALEKTAWGVNVVGTKNLVDACKNFGKKIIYISTDFVFDGKKKHYDENDLPDPINWYAKTKYEGEKIVRESGLDFLILRLSYPFRAYFTKNDFVRTLIDKLGKAEEVKVVTDHIMVPTFIDDFSNALDILIQKEETGIFHVVGSEAITPFDAAIKIAARFDLDETLISKTTRSDYFRGKAPRPFCLNLKNDKISHLGIEMSSFDEGLSQIKNQREIAHI